MNLEQVKEHFKYAKEVRCAYNGELMDIGKLNKNEIHYVVDGFWLDFPQKTHGTNCMLYNTDANQLAEILTYIFDRGEEVEVSDNLKDWKKRKFISFDLKGYAIIEGNPYVNNAPIAYTYIRKLTPESLLEPQLTELNKVAEANGMSVEIIFKLK